MSTKSSTSTNLHQHHCKPLMSQCSLTLVYLSAILTARMLNGAVRHCCFDCVNSVDGKWLDDWASSKSLALLYNPKDSVSFHFGRWNSGTNPDLVLASADSENRLPNRRALEKFPKSQHRPSLITSPRFA